MTEERSGYGSAQSLGNFPMSHIACMSFVLPLHEPARIGQQGIMTLFYFHKQWADLSGQLPAIGFHYHFSLRVHCFPIASWEAIDPKAGYQVIFHVIAARNRLTAYRQGDRTSWYKNMWRSGFGSFFSLGSLVLPFALGHFFQVLHSRFWLS